MHEVPLRLKMYLHPHAEQRRPPSASTKTLRLHYNSIDFFAGTPYGESRLFCIFVFLCNSDMNNKLSFFVGLFFAFALVGCNPAVDPDGKGLTIPNLSQNLMTPESLALLF